MSTFFSINRKRVLIFPNGESITRAVYVWGESIQEILDNAAARLNLHKPGKILVHNGWATGKNKNVYSQLRLIRPHQNTEKLRIIRSAELTVVFNKGGQWSVS